MSKFRPQDLLVQIKKMKIKDLQALVLLIVTFIPGKLYKVFNNDVWIITEYKDDARDNGYWLFKYIRENYPEKKVYYPINLNSSDFSKIRSLGNFIKFGGIKHYILFWGCNKFIGTTKYYGLPYGRICDDLVKWGIPGFKYVFLNHGFSRGYASIIDDKETNYQLLMAMSELEKEIMIKDNGQKAENIVNVGFCRHDNLDSNKLNKKVVLIMPTWRNWLDSRDKFMDDENRVMKEFFESDYFIKWRELIDSKMFADILDKNNLVVKFYIHEYAKKYLKYFESDNPRIMMVSPEGNFVQDLLKEAALLITDYSSVSFDFAYMKKPVIYFQFDLEKFEKNQYQQGNSYSYDKNGFGKVYKELNDVIIEFSKLANYDFGMNEEYLKRVYDFFEFSDKNNCKRNYEAIDKL